jgi:hypothetical protein
MAMRNYGAMLDEKLLRCITELRGGHGEAYERVRRQSKYPANNVGENLKVATAVARDRGLRTVARDHGLPTPAESAPPDPPKPKPKPVCRGCAGTGVDITVPARVMQVAEGPWDISSSTARWMFTLGVSDTYDCLPLLALLDTLAKAKAEGREVIHGPSGAVIPFPLDKEHACTWCNGTGEPTNGDTP